MEKLYLKVASEIENYIKNMDLISNHLPPERELAEMYNVSRQTIRHALDECEKNGLIERRQGSGIYLSDRYLKSVNRIALLLPSRDEYIFPSFITALEKRVNSCSYTLDIYETGDNLGEQAKILRWLLLNPVKQIIIWPIRNMLPVPHTDIYKKLDKKGINILFIDNPYINLKNYSYIKSDNFYSGYSIGGRVIAEGKKWCAIFMHDNSASSDRYFGFVQSLYDLGANIIENDIHWFSYSALLDCRYKKNNLWLQNIIKSYASLPQIFICNNDEVAYWLLKTMESLHIPTDDLIIYSFDNSFYTEITGHKLYSYSTDINFIAGKITEYIVKTSKKEKEVITLPSSLY